LINAGPKNDFLDFGGPGWQAIAFFNRRGPVDLRTSAKASQQAAVSADLQ
jgi:hypothetical protein